MLVLGMIGCACYMLGDQLWMFLAYGQESEELGLMLDSRWLDMPYWRFMASILLGAVGTPLYYLGFREMGAALQSCPDTAYHGESDNDAPVAGKPV